MWEQLENFLVEIVRAELEYQKHNATGTLSSSVRVETTQEGGLVVLKGYIEDYGAYVDLGRAKGVTRIPIQPLIEWARIKNIADDPVRFAYAVREKIFKEGIPTDGSRRIADRRLNFIQEALDRSLNDIREMIYNADKEIIQIDIRNIVRETNRQLNG